MIVRLTSLGLGEPQVPSGKNATSVSTGFDIIVSAASAWEVLHGARKQEGTLALMAGP